VLPSLPPNIRASGCYRVFTVAFCTKAWHSRFQCNMLCGCRGLSSKYFVWDPDLPFLSLGTLSVLQEIEVVQRLHARGCGLLRHSYLGFYIHSNRKMRCAAPLLKFVCA
jgi:Arginine-tRNA-protein transferase, C terminus